jgi:hypothetical protein
MAQVVRCGGRETAPEQGECRMKRILAVVVSAVLVSFAPAAWAENQYETAVRGYLDTQHKLDGYSQDRGTADWVNGLRAGQPQFWEIQLARGATYTIVGVCDEDCTDVDMEVSDSNGNMVGSDTLADDYPRVQLTPAASGTFSVKIWLHACSSEPCYAGARVLRRN